MAEVTEKPKNEDSSAPAKTESKLELRPPRKLCCYSQRVCNLEILKGFDFCHKHILEDKASPFKPCDFVAKSNGRRCPNPAQKLPDRGKSFCIIHTRKAELRRAVEERRKRRHHDDNEGSYDDDKGKRRRTSSSNSQKSDKLDGHSSDEDGVGSGDDYLKVDSAWHGDIDSDADSVDSEEEDFLKHAGVWTVEEATRMCRDKMIRLRSLYISQFKRLQHVLKERRRKYCQAIQAEEVEETGECHLTPTQLLGRKPQHECPGTEALLHRQAKEKKQGGISTRQQGASTLRCTYSPGGNRCTEKVLPLTKHCVKHITHDPNQLLFQKCTFPPKGDSHCERNVAKIFTHSACRLHVELPTDMKRPNISNDLLDAKERAKLRKTRALESKVSEADVPEALQEKSSALVAPTTSGQPDESGPVTTEPPQQASASSLPSTQSSTPSISSEKMEVDNKIDEKIDVDVNKLSSNSVPTKASSSASSSGGLQSISPGLAAASLVAVCSSPQLPFQGTPLASVSSIPQSSVTDSKSLPSGSDKARSVSNAPSEASKVDVDSKVADVKAAADLKDIKGSEAAKPKSTNTFLPGGNNTHAQAQRPVSPGKQPEQSKVVLNVTKLKQEAKVPASTSPPVSQTTAKAAPSHGTQKASSNTTSQNVTQIPPLESPEKPSQVISKSALQGTLPGIVHEPQKALRMSPQKAPHKFCSSAPINNGQFLSQTAIENHQCKALVAIETGQPLKTVSTKPSTTSETTQPLKSTSAKPSITSEMGQPLKTCKALDYKRNRTAIENNQRKALDYKRNGTAIEKHQCKALDYKRNGTAIEKHQCKALDYKRNRTAIENNQRKALDYKRNGTAIEKHQCKALDYKRNGTAFEKHQYKALDYKRDAPFCPCEIFPALASRDDCSKLQAVQSNHISNKQGHD
ncbi:KAT8 regulatory NSL complex subunit 2 [Desmophyllum pertusum]|uniref:KAT8 regulatory NSL complex subunit 2 n=1 Tax=Desmophyllum pertusum TaxID=174260 RepID=A0A9W9Z5D8_9CNID|nr:KAT8 regulatory NSL complex subunit 2 [Desmophyllum pertusum]